MKDLIKKFDREAYCKKKACLESTHCDYCIESGKIINAAHEHYTNELKQAHQKQIEQMEALIKIKREHISNLEQGKETNMDTELMKIKMFYFKEGLERSLGILKGEDND